MIVTNRLKIYAASTKQMKAFIEKQTDEILKAAYIEMLNGCLLHPDMHEWYAIWMIELKDGTHIGELCFKGLSYDGVAEIGYGINANYRNFGFATEAVKALTNWAIQQNNANSVIAETEKTNIASQKVLLKAGFLPTGKPGVEGPIYIFKNNKK